jgi:uncharacterized protein involved in type VI secretion and phage assembly
MSTVQQEGSAEVGGWDAKTGRPINGSSSSATTTSTAGVQRGALLGDFRNEKLGIVDRFVDNQQEAAALAKSALNRRADAHFEAEARCQGTPGIRAGGKVQIEGVGTKFSGTYVVSSVTHLYRGKKGYQTSFTISGRSERGLLDLVHPPAKREWSRHLVVGIVTNVNDPDKLGRVRVKYPSLPAGSGGDLESSWAQMVTLGASNQRGALMLPEIDDEVIVGFENGDARRPLILGACFHGMKKPSPDLLQDNDGSFAMVSNKKSFMKTAEDMTFKSDKDLIIEISGDDKEKVDGQVELKAGSSYKVEAGTSVTLKGNSITVEAASSLKLKGATVDIESSGPASFKGAMVNVEASGPASLKGAMVNIG